ncbi:MAG: class I mannose-6-phosphate isomerase [Conexibacteraceae bacterium]|nr:class I mannose-6-phosphate isomerase [Conexibacteraceae bacterium]
MGGEHLDNPRFSGAAAAGTAGNGRAPSTTRPAPVILPPNPVFRFYEGGDGIDVLRGIEPGAGPGAPEDWVGSTTTSFGNPVEGLSRLADGALLRDLIDADPVGYLGPEHVARLGANPGLLVKLLDAGERLAVHFHPGREFARSHLNSRFGKTEAWIILAAAPGAEMHLGLREPIDQETLSRWVVEQDSDVMLAALHRVPVKAGDVLFVPAGTLHTIGAGITLVELQEPSDMSAVIEWRLAGVDNGDEHLQLGWDVILPAADTEAGSPSHATPEPVAAGTSAARNLLPPEADGFFRAERLTLGGPDLELEPAFSIVIATGGEITLITQHNRPLRLASGVAALIPHGAGTTTVSGNGTALRCLPPALGSLETASIEAGA